MKHENLHSSLTSNHLVATVSFVGAEFSSSGMPRACGAAVGSSGDQPASPAGETSAGTVAPAVQAPTSGVWCLCQGVSAR